MTTEALYLDFKSRLLAFIKARVDDPATAEDLLQEVFVRIHLNKEALRQEQKLTSWLYQITRNVIADHYRAQRPQAAMPQLVAEQLPTQGSHDFTRCLTSMIAQLPPDYATALQQTALGAHSQKSYAQAAGISYSGAKSRVQRAKEKLKDLFVSCCAIEADVYGNIIEAKENCNC